MNERNFAPAPPQDEGALVAAAVRQADKDRFFATLLVPEPARQAVMALYAFSAEVARVREVVSDPLPGEMRCQWWRDAVAGEARGDVQAHPVAAALLAAVRRYRLPREPLLALIEARTFDLYDDAMPTMGDLEGYCGETSSALLRLAALALADGAEPGDPDLPGHGGVAYALTGLMRALAWHASQGQVFLPADLMARFGVTREDVLAGRDGEGLRLLLRELRGRARDHLGAARRLQGAAPAAVRPAFLPLALVEPYLRRMDRPDYRPFATPVDMPDWQRIARLWWAAKRGW